MIIMYIYIYKYVLHKKCNLLHAYLIYILFFPELNKPRKIIKKKTGRAGATVRQICEESKASVLPGCSHFFEVSFLKASLGSGWKLMFCHPSNFSVDILIFATVAAYVEFRNVSGERDTPKALSDRHLAG